MGVYAGFARILSQEAGSNPDDQAGNHKRSDNLAYPAMANIGFRPVLDPESPAPKIPAQRGLRRIPVSRCT